MFLFFMCLSLCLCVFSAYVVIVFVSCFYGFSPYFFNVFVILVSLNVIVLV
jgi:hypothetical protein